MIVFNSLHLLVDNILIVYKEQHAAQSVILPAYINLYSSIIVYWQAFWKGNELNTTIDTPLSCLFVFKLSFGYILGLKVLLLIIVLFFVLFQA